MNKRQSTVANSSKMTQSLELSDKDFKAAITKMLQWIIMNTLETNGKKKSQRQKKKKHMEILEWKNTITETKNSLDDPNRMEGTEERIYELDDKTVEFTYLKSKEKIVK